LIQTRSHVRNAIASRERQVVMRKVKSTIKSNDAQHKKYLLILSNEMYFISLLVLTQNVVLCLNCWVQFCFDTYSSDIFFYYQNSGKASFAQV